MPIETLSLRVPHPHYDLVDYAEVGQLCLVAVAQLHPVL
jgi:hypothetical protein